MLAREYDRKDAPALDELLGLDRAGDVRLERDKIVVYGPVGRPVSALVWRPCAFVHEFHCGFGLSRRFRAASMLNFAIGAGMSQLHPISDAIFSVDPMNLPMLKYVEGELQATEQTEKFYTLPLRRTYP
jgi:hypothetical protein